MSFIGGIIILVSCQNSVQNTEVAEALNNYTLIEKTESYIVKNSAEFFQDGSTNVDKTGEFVSRNYIDELPTAIIIRDGVGTKALDMLADNFETRYVLEDGEDHIPDSLLRSIDPDYIIYLCGEDGLGDMFKN